MDNQSLQIQIDQLNKRLDELMSSNTLPRQVETAIRDRIADIQNMPGTATTSSISATPFNQPNVTGTIPMKIKGKIYYILYQ